MFLTPLEVAELTGRPQPKRQIKWLTDKRWLYETGADGRPKVSRAYALQRLGDKGAISQWEPDWSKV